jgi:hypothetical protein
MMISCVNLKINCPEGEGPKSICQGKSFEKDDGRSKFDIQWSYENDGAVEFVFEVPIGRKRSAWE